MQAYRQQWPLGNLLLEEILQLVGKNFLLVALVASIYCCSCSLNGSDGHDGKHHLATLRAIVKQWKPQKKLEMETACLQIKRCTFLKKVHHTFSSFTTNMKNYRQPLQPARNQSNHHEVLGGAPCLHSISPDSQQPLETTANHLGSTLIAIVQYGGQRSSIVHMMSREKISPDIFLHF